MATYQPPKLGDRVDGMEWTGASWTVVCPACDIPMTEYDARAELCCPQCGVSHLEWARTGRP